MVVASHSGYLLIQPNEVMRLDASARVIGPVPVTGSRIAVAGDVAAILNGALVSWFRVGQTSPVVESAVYAPVLKPQTFPAAASDGVGFLASWHERTMHGEAVTSARFTRHPQPLDGPGIPAAATAADAKPAVAFGGGRYLVVWSEATRLSAVFIGLDGTAGEPFTVRTGYLADPAVVWNGSSFFVVWAEELRIFGATISSSGVVGARRDIPPTNRADARYSSPDVAWDGAQHIVVWLNATLTGGAGNCPVLPCPASPTEVLAARAAGDGTPLDAAPISVVASTPFQAIDDVDVAAGGPAALIAIDRRARIDLAELRFDGVSSSTRTLFEWIHAGTRWLASDVAFDGSGYVVGWRFQDSRKAFTAVERIGAGSVRQSTPAGLPTIPAVSVALNAGREAAIVASEVFTRGESPRVTATFAADIPFAPEPPAMPRGLAAHIAGTSVSVSWSAVAGVEGYVVETEQGAMLGNAPAGATELEIPYPYRGSLRVRAYNAGGLSAPSPAVIVGLLPRRRSARH
jgi:hypothetical protein